MEAIPVTTSMVNIITLLLLLPLQVLVDQLLLAEDHLLGRLDPIRCQNRLNLVPQVMPLLPTVDLQLQTKVSRLLLERRVDTEVEEAGSIVAESTSGTIHDIHLSNSTTTTAELHRIVRGADPQEAIIVEIAGVIRGAVGACPTTENQGVDH